MTTTPAGLGHHAETFREDWLEGLVDAYSRTVRRAPDAFGVICRPPPGRQGRGRHRRRLRALPGVRGPGRPRPRRRRGDRRRVHQPQRRAGLPHRQGRRRRRRRAVQLRQLLGRRHALRARRAPARRRRHRLAHGAGDRRRRQRAGRRQRDPPGRGGRLPRLQGGRRRGRTRRRPGDGRRPRPAPTTGPAPSASPSPAAPCPARRAAVHRRARHDGAGPGHPRRTGPAHRRRVTPTNSPTNWSTTCSTSSPTGGDGRVAVLLNGLGSTQYEDLFVIYGRVNGRLLDAGLRPHRPEVGEFVTSLDMAGSRCP